MGPAPRRGVALLAMTRRPVFRMARGPHGDRTIRAGGTAKRRVRGPGARPRSSAGSRKRQSRCRAYPTSYTALYALCRDGSLWGWGHGGYGNLAQGNTSHSYSPVRCKKTGDEPLEDVVGLWPGHGDYNACFALTRDGRLRAVGQNAWGKLGVDDGLNNQNLFTEVVGLPSISPVLKVAPCGSSYSAATAVLLKDGSIWTAGSGGYGFHGDGTTDDRHSFEQLPLPSGVGAALDLWGGGQYAQLWFTGDDANTYACGYNGVGQLGIGNTTGTITTPTRVALPDGVTARMISTGGAKHRHSTIMLGNALFGQELLGGGDRGDLERDVGNAGMLLAHIH